MDFRLAYAHRRSPLRVSLNYVKIVYFKCRLRLRPLFFFFTSNSTDFNNLLFMIYKWNQIIINFNLFIPETAP